MHIIKLVGLIMVSVFLLNINGASASVTNRTINCGDEGNDICITYTDWDWIYAQLNPSWALEQNIAAIKYYYPIDYEQRISAIHENGIGHDLDWIGRIWWEVTAHTDPTRPDPDMHYSIYYLSKPCQLNNNCGIV